MEGWRELGYVLGGGGKNNPDAYHSGLQTVARSEGMLADAARKQAMRMMFDSQAEQRRRLLQDAALQAELGWSPGQTALFGASEMGTFNQNAQGQGYFQKQNLRQQALEALAPELGVGNAALAAMAGKPIERMKVQGDMAFDPFIAGGDMRATELGKARIAKAGRDNVNWGVQATDQGLVQVNPRTGEVRPLVLGDDVLVRPPSASKDPNAAIDNMLAKETFYALANPDMAPADQQAAVARLKSAAEQLKQGRNAAPNAVERKVVKTGTHNGRRVVQYEDGSIEYAD